MPISLYSVMSSSYTTAWCPHLFRYYCRAFEHSSCWWAARKITAGLELWSLSFGLWCASAVKAASGWRCLAQQDLINDTVLSAHSTRSVCLSVCHSFSQRYWVLPWCQMRWLSQSNCPLSVLTCVRSVSTTLIALWWQWYLYLLHTRRSEYL